jgi:hypothetical protein
VKLGTPTEEILSILGKTLDENQEMPKAVLVHLCRLKFLGEDKWIVLFFRMYFREST